MRYVFSILGILIGMFFVIKSEWMLKAFGYSEWAETKFGIWGGSRTAYKLGGLLIIIISLMWLTGWLQEILLFIFSPMRSLG